MANTPYSARPSSLGTPVPGKQSALDELSAMEAPSAKSMSALDQLSAPEAPPPPEQPGMAGQALDAAGRTLDYPGGFMRAGLANVAGLATGQGNIVKPEDLQAAAVGKGPSSAEYLKRLGVSEGWSANVPGLGKVTARGAEGLALDIATDPLTAVAKLAKEVPYIKNLLNAPGAASEAIGEAVYKSGFKKIDAKLAAKGEAPLSDIMLAEGKTGTTAKLADDVENMSRTIGGIRQGLYDKATQLGAAVEMSEISFKNADAVLARMKKDRGLAPAAEALEEMLNRYKAPGKETLENLSSMKTSLYDALPAEAFDGFGKIRGSANQLKGALAADLRNAIVAAGNGAEKGLGDSVNALNEKWGTLLAAQEKALPQQVKQAASQSIGSWIDAALLGAGHSHSVAAKKAMELASTTYLRTKVGKAMIDVGQNGLATGAFNRAVINSQQKP